MPTPTFERAGFYSNLETGLNRSFSLCYRFNRPDHVVRDYKIVKILPGNSGITFPLDNNATGKPEQVSVKDYFEKRSPDPV